MKKWLVRGKNSSGEMPRGKRHGLRHCRFNEEREAGHGGEKQTKRRGLEGSKAEAGDDGDCTRQGAMRATRAVTTEEEQGEEQATASKRASKNEAEHLVGGHGHTRHFESRRAL